jgi:hypothetical protein
MPRARCRRWSSRSQVQPFSGTEVQRVVRITGPIRTLRSSPSCRTAISGACVHAGSTRRFTGPQKIHQRLHKNPEFPNGRCARRLAAPGETDLSRLGLAVDRRHHGGTGFVQSGFDGDRRQKRGSLPFSHHVHERVQTCGREISSGVAGDRGQQGDGMGVKPSAEKPSPHSHCIKD